jgi:hypothetical protein
VDRQEADQQDQSVSCVLWWRLLLEVVLSLPPLSAETVRRSDCATVGCRHRPALEGGATGAETLLSDRLVPRRDRSSREIARDRPSIDQNQIEIEQLSDRKPHRLLPAKIPPRERQTV